MGKRRIKVKMAEKGPQISKKGTQKAESARQNGGSGQKPQKGASNKQGRDTKKRKVQGKMVDPGKNGGEGVEARGAGRRKSIAGAGTEKKRGRAFWTKCK